MKQLFTLLLISVSLYSFGAAPTTASSNLWFGAIDGGYFNLGWTPGNGARRIMVCKAGSMPGFVPQNGIDYDANTTFGLGQQVAPGEFIVYDHFSTSFFLVGLNPATQYFFKVYEYNGSGSTTEYLTSQFLSGSQSTSASPTLQTSNAMFTNVTTNSLTVNWTNGNGFRRLIVVREGSPVTSNPVSGQPYNSSTIFGNGATTAAGDYTVYASTGSGTSVTNLKPGTQYYFAFYEYNGNSQPQYLSPAYTIDVTTRSVPTIASSNLIITKTDGKELFLGWTNGNGQRRIIIAKKGSDVTSIPVNGIDYTANPSFGLGQQINAGEFVVYNSNFNAIGISGLDPASNYYFRIFEYDGTGSSTSYLTSNFAAVNGSTAITPTVQSSSFSTINLAANSLTLQLTPGNGRARLIIGKKQTAVDAIPADFTSYTANSDFGSGQDLANGNFVLASTTETMVNVHQLEGGTTYHFAVFEYNGFNQPMYLNPAASISATTLVILPVRLVSWNAVSQGEKVKLTWKTSEEFNSREFIIERSNDGFNFLSIKRINAAGNSQSEKTYSVWDEHPLQGSNYYRLKMIDIDGSYEYSTVVKVIRAEHIPAQLINNPVTDRLEIIHSPVIEQKTQWEIFSSTGSRIQKGKLSSSKTSIETGLLPRGNYWIRLSIGDETKSFQFVKL